MDYTIACKFRYITLKVYIAASNADIGYRHYSFI